MLRVWRALLPVQLGFSVRSMSASASSSALEFLSEFVNYEKKSMPAHAGMDTSEGFDLVSLGVERSGGLEGGALQQPGLCRRAAKELPLYSKVIHSDVPCISSPCA